MKVILTAFGEKLTSKPIDWPDNMSGQDIYLPLDMERLKVMPEPRGNYLVESTIRKRGRFQSIRMFHVGEGEKRESAEIYKLVDIS